VLLSHLIGKQLDGPNDAISDSPVRKKKHGVAGLMLNYFL
jgi:hypothetical protein